MIESVYTVFALAFGLGILHAFDADHIMAVSSLSFRREGKSPLSRSVIYCARWAMGHGGAVLLLALAFYSFDWQLAESTIKLAEQAIGLILIIIGGVLLWQFCRHQIRLDIHTHGDESETVKHVHLVKADGSTWHDHSPIFVGVVHGVAGSAPLLALLPTLMLEQGSSALIYIAMFCIGVLIAMLVFGLGLAYLQQGLIRFGDKVFQVSRLLMSMSALLFGCYWLAQA